MEITWHGLSCFTFQGKEGTVVVDPYEQKHAGIKAPKFSADLFLANDDSELHAKAEDLGKDIKIFNWPGEYEVKNIIVQGIPAYDRPRDKESKKGDEKPVIVFTMELDRFKICHLSNIGHKLTPEMIEAIGDTDILLIPVGGNGTLDAAKAHEVIEQIDPRIVIPMYYKIPGVKLPLGEIGAFLKEVGVAGQTPEKTVKFQTPSQLPQEKTEFRILEPALG